MIGTMTTDAPAVVEAIYVAVTGGAPMRAVDRIEAVAGEGLAGDRYPTGQGYWSGTDECQVTMIQAEALDEIASRTAVDVSHGQHRRNIVTRGVDLRSLAGRRFRIGGALFEYDRPRPPCRYIESITEPGMTRALAARRGGICVRVLESGTIAVGEPIEVLEGRNLLRAMLRR